MSYNYNCRNYGIERYIAGPQTLPTQSSLHHSRGGVSHQWKGPGFYLPFPHSRYANQNEIWDPVMQGIDRNSLNTNGSFHEEIYPHNHQPFNQKWNTNRPIFHSAHHNKWLNEHAVTFIPRDARLFYNEGDWMKYKHMVQFPYIKGTNGQPIPPRNRNQIKFTGKRSIKCSRDHEFYF